MDLGAEKERVKGHASNVWGITLGKGGEEEWGREGLPHPVVPLWSWRVSGAQPLRFPSAWRFPSPILILSFPPLALDLLLCAVSWSFSALIKNTIIPLTPFSEAAFYQESGYLFVFFPSSLFLQVVRDLLWVSGVSL